LPAWAWGFTLNRVSLFALIFSIGILVDDAIVVVENIHRHQQLDPGKALREIIPAAVDEVGGPTILATLTVIAALLPMAFVSSGLMGPYMSPIPINSSLGMAISLAIAFTVTPWLALKLMKPCTAGMRRHGRVRTGLPRPGCVQRLFTALLRPCWTARASAGCCWLGILAALALSVGLAGCSGWC
jgi:multidrug efflux pump subunit AcrB